MMSMTQRLTFGYALAVTGGVVAALAVGGWLLEREMVGGIDALHELEFMEVMAGLGNDPQTLPLDRLVAELREHSEADKDFFLFQVHDADGRILFRSPTLGSALLPDLSAAGASWTVDIPPFGRVHTSEFVAGRLHFQIASRLAPSEQVLRRYTQVSVVIASLAAVASLGLGFGISRLALRPLRDIERTARRIGADNLAERIPEPAGRDEVAELVRLLNAMIGRLEGSFRQVREFSADASHELKTPLTLIRLHAERLRARLADNPAGAAVDELLEELAGMNEVIDRLLFLSRMEGGGLAPNRTRQDTTAWLAATAEDAAALAEDRGARLEVAANAGGTARFDPALLRQLVLNLVSNALRFSRPGGTITLRSDRVGGTWRIEVIDEGPGLPADQLERIFERYVRGEGAVAGATGGHGLGLTICRSIVRLHGGTIQAANRVDRSGLRMEVRLPQEAAE